MVIIIKRVVFFTVLPRDVTEIQEQRRDIDIKNAIEVALKALL